MDPKWLCGKSHYLGTVIGFLARNGVDSHDAIVRLDETITIDGFTGDILVISLRYVGAKWTDTETVHVTLWENIPDADAWDKDSRSHWIESHATYQRIRRQ